jgi:hypothetical protein
VSSITDNGTGDYTVNFTTAMPDANYASTLTALSSAQRLSVTSSQTVSAIRIETLNASFGGFDAAQVHLAIFR